MNKSLFRLLVILSALNFACMLAVYPYLPALTPTNWSLDGVADSYGPKWMNLLLACVPLAFALLMRALPYVDPKRKNWQNGSRPYSIFTAAFTIMLIVLCWAITLPSLGLQLPVASLICLLVGVPFIIMGNYMPQFRQSYFVGIRTPWALEDETNWRKTHRFGGFVFCLGGIVLCIGALFPSSIIAIAGVGLLLAGSVAAYIYSYMLYRRRSTRPN